MKPDKYTVPKLVEDRGEDRGRMDPVLITKESRHYSKLVDLSLELAMKSAALRHTLPEGVLTTLATLVRAMNCYYSNLIEGHKTSPIEIEQALKDDYSAEPEKRNLQLEARAHIEVQKWIDEGGLRGRALDADGVAEVHRRFCEKLPKEFLVSRGVNTSELYQVVPGAFRTCDVQIGKHVPVSPGAVPRFLKRFTTVYSNLGTTDTILAAAAAHHRFLWIHPFLDGNGRVARLMSHVVLRDTLDTGGLWSIARGLARNVTEYRNRLSNCDQLRRNDVDGRGNLSEDGLAEFTEFFLHVCIDQVNFMADRIAPDRLRNRILIWAEEEIRAGKLPPKSGVVLDAVLYRGELPRADVPTLLGTKERQARRVTSTLTENEVLVSDSSRAPFRIAFPARLASRWLPGLYVES